MNRHNNYHCGYENQRISFAQRVPSPSSIYAKSDFRAAPSTLTSTPEGLGRRVAFRERTNVYTYGTDLKHDDEAFMRAARSFIDSLTCSKENRNQGWFSSLFPNMASKESYRDEAMNPQEVEGFRDAFEYRLRNLPEVRAGKHYEKTDSVVRELVSVLQNVNWPSHEQSVRMNEDYNHPAYNQSRRHELLSHSWNHIYTHNDVRNLVRDMRKRLSENDSIDSIMREIKWLENLAMNSNNRDDKILCEGEINSLETLLESLGVLKTTKHSIPIASQTSDEIGDVRDLSYQMKKRLAEDNSIESMMRELEYLHEVESSTTRRDIKAFCISEAKSLESALESYGIVKGNQINSHFHGCMNVFKR